MESKHLLLLQLYMIVTTDVVKFVIIINFAFSLTTLLPWIEKLLF